MKLFNSDCLKGMKEYPNKYFDLAVVDPPYGLKQSGVQSGGKTKNRAFNRSEVFKWDIAPKKEYFDELFRISKNQIIWGGNYFNLPPTRCVICWNKKQPWETFSQWEMAWTSFNSPAPMFTFDNRFSGKIHPTQKPVALYSWILKKYAFKGAKILDTHLGSGSICIAVLHHKELKIDLTGFEINEEYYNNIIKRINAFKGK